VTSAEPVIVWNGLVAPAPRKSRDGPRGGLRSHQVTVFKRRQTDPLLELDDVERRLKPLARVYMGVRAIPLDHVVGTDSKAGAFTRDFRPQHDFTRDRLRSLEEAFPDGGFPPITAVKLGDTYFVVDGHHRVALARRRGGEMIDASITEFLSPAPLPAGADMVEVVLRQLELVFLDESGLTDSRPGVRIAASRPAVYLELLENMQVHGYHLMQAQDRALTKAEVSGDWYDTIFAPVMEAVERNRLGGHYRDAPDADVFLLLHQQRRDDFPSCGCPPLAETVDTVAAETSAKRSSRRR
jgi:hypothetical protein